MPISFCDPTAPSHATTHHLQPTVAHELSAKEDHDVLGVYATLGTIFNQESGDLFRRLVSGLATVDADVLLTVGTSIDPSEVGSQPANVRVERFVPLPSALAGRDLVVSHAGSGTVMGSLSAGLPSVLLPMGADQPWNADRGRALGVAVELDPETASPTDIASAVVETLHSASHHAAAQRVRAEIAGLPGIDHGADLLELLGRNREALPTARRPI